MTRSRIVHAAATGAAALMLLLGAMSCSSNTVVGAGARPPTQSDSNGDYAQNAMAVVEPPRAYQSPPPPPLQPPIVSGEREEAERLEMQSAPAVRSARPRLAAPATDTQGDVAEGPDEAVNEPFAGLGTFATPPVLTVGIPYTLKFFVGKDQAGLNSVSEDRALMKARSVWMAQTMRVTLDPNPAFTIQPQNEDQEIQDLSPERTAAWLWIVTPLTNGPQTLTARVQALVRGPDGELVKGPNGKLKGPFYPPRSIDIDVQVGAKKKVLNAIGDASSFGDAFTGLFKSWEKMLIALAALVAAAGGVWAAARKLKAGT
jgi:hypothetical protein